MNPDIITYYENIFWGIIFFKNLLYLISYHMYFTYTYLVYFTCTIFYITKFALHQKLKCYKSESVSQEQPQLYNF